VVVKIIIIIIVVVMRSGEKAADLRMAADDQTALCIRVMVSMSAIVETPRPSSDTSGSDTAIYAETALYRVITLETQKKSRTFLDDLSGKINPNSPWTSRMKNELQYEWSTAKLYDDLKTLTCTSQFMHSSHQSLATSILLDRHNQIPWPALLLPDCGLFPDFSLTLAEFRDISMFPKIPDPVCKFYAIIFAFILKLVVVVVST